MSQESPSTPPANPGNKIKDVRSGVGGEEKKKKKRRYVPISEITRSSVYLYHPLFFSKAAYN